NYPYISIRVKGPEKIFLAGNSHPSWQGGRDGSRRLFEGMGWFAWCSAHGTTDARSRWWTGLRCTAADGTRGLVGQLRQKASREVNAFRQGADPGCQGAAAMSQRVSAALRRLIQTRARGRCEYCLIHECSSSTGLRLCRSASG